jgi:hypothetical protein
MTAQDPADARNIVAGIEGIPGGPSRFVERLPSRLRRPSVHVAEGDVAHERSRRWPGREPSRARAGKKLPGNVGEPLVTQGIGRQAIRHDDVGCP